MQGAAVCAQGDGAPFTACIYHRQIGAVFHALQDEEGLVHIDIFLIGSAMDLYGVAGTGVIDGVLYYGEIAVAIFADRQDIPASFSVGEVLVGPVIAFQFYRAGNLNFNVPGFRCLVQAIGAGLKAAELVVAGGVGCRTVGLAGGVSQDDLPAFQAFFGAIIELVAADA